MSMTKVNIQEANTHLRQLHKKVYELENKIHMQVLHSEELEAANLKLKQQLQKSREDSAAALKEKEEIVSELQKRLEESEQHVQSLLSAAEERDALLEKLEKKARLFYEVVDHRSTLANMVKVLDELTIDDGHLSSTCDGEVDHSDKKMSRQSSGMSNGTQECNGQNGECDGDV